MSASTTLLMAVHCHQPVGNFGFVFEEAYAKAYAPFLEALERHPAVRLALHYSGSLLDWLQQHHPAFLTRLRALVRRGQVELLASGYYEPILPLIPEADRQGQIALMRERLRELCGAHADGLWLTERVWEPDLPSTLARAGIRYTMVDTNQFHMAQPWLPTELQVHDESFWDLLGCYATDCTGDSLLVFPASKRLRYWMPFQPVERTIEFLKRLKRDPPAAITFADDGEKFGFWPSTFHWVYETGWLDQFFTALERERDWLTTTTFHDYVARTRPHGTVYLPSGSYEEMLEWSGGYFRNFFTKYPEANAMQQKMLRVSQTLAELKTQPLKALGSRLKAPGLARGSRLEALGNSTGLQPRAYSLEPPRASSLPGPLRPQAGAGEPRAKRREALLRQAQQELYAGQCNCAYWHGVFGGLYLSSLRRAVYSHLIAAEALADQARGRGPSVELLDLDGDGDKEASLKTATMGLVVDPDDGGGVTEWSLYGPRINLLDTLSRRHEPYHEKLKAHELQPAMPRGDVPSSIHDLLGVKEQNLPTHLAYDDHRRSSFLDYALSGLPTLQDVIHSSWGERRLWPAGPFRLDRCEPSTPKHQSLTVTMVREIGGGIIRKTVCVPVHRTSVEFRYELERLHVPVVAMEFNLSLRDERYLQHADERLHSEQFALAEPSAGVTLSLSIEPPATLFHFPIETVSESEQGLERTYQGLCLVCLWELDGSDAWTSRVRLTVT